jgi:FtsZ-interacting cell division protein ZipA
LSGRNIKPFEVIVISIAVLAIAGLFVRGFWADKENYEKAFSGVVKQKYKGSKGSLVVLISENKKQESKSIFNPTIFAWQAITENDSVYKSASSYYVYFYSKKNGLSYFKDSFELYHY